MLVLDIDSRIRINWNFCEENKPLFYITVSGMVGRIEKPTVNEVARVHQENREIKGLENNDT